MEKKLIFYAFLALILVVGMSVPIIAEALTDREELMQSSSSSSKAYTTSSTSRQGSSPFDPPEENDASFVTDAAPMLDTGCIYRSSGPIVYDIEIDRYVGDLNSDGTLKNVAELIDSGIISEEATLLMPGWDIDSNAEVEDGQPEIDRVLFNGEEIGFLDGENNEWKLNSFKIPIEKIKFADKTSGGTPVAALNEVKIEIDTGNSEEWWCTDVDWGSLSFEAMPPVILIHGNSSDSGFWKRQGFTQALGEKHIPYHDTINLNTDTVKINGQTLKDKLLNAAESMGVQNIQIVAHSKGGLDIREFLGKHYSELESSEELKVHTFTTLSTPHKGSVGADFIKAIEETLNFKLENSNERTDFAEKVVKDYTSEDWIANRDLTTDRAAEFNASNNLPSDIRYYSVGADADINWNNNVERNEYQEVLDEAEHPNVWDYMVNDRMNALYKGIGNFSSATVQDTGRVTWWGKTPIWELVEVPTSSFQENDMAVTYNSSKYNGFLSIYRYFKKNHYSIADEEVANRVIERLKSVQ